MVPPAPVLDHLGSALVRLRGRPGEPRWSARPAQHVTLAFFGDVPAARVGPLTAALEAVTGSPSVHLRLSGAGTFPERGAPRVLWVGLDGDLAGLAALAGGVAVAGASARVEPRNDGRPYRPHLTVGRWPAAGPADRRLAAALAGYAGPHFAVEEWELVRSHPGPAVRYETLARWSLPGG